MADMEWRGRCLNREGRASGRIIGTTRNSEGEGHGMKSTMGDWKIKRTSSHTISTQHRLHCLKRPFETKPNFQIKLLLPLHSSTPFRLDLDISLLQTILPTVPTRLTQSTKLETLKQRRRSCHRPCKTSTLVTVQTHLLRKRAGGIRWIG